MATLKPPAVRQQIADATTDPIYLVQGEDEVEKSALAMEFEAVVEEGLRAFNVERIHAGELTSGDKIVQGVGDLVAAVRTLPMMVPRRVVVVFQAQALLAPKRESEAAARAIGDLEALITSPEPQTTLVLVSTPLDQRTRMFKTLQKHAAIVACGVIEDLAGAEQWIRSRIHEAGIEIESGAAHWLG